MIRATPRRRRGPARGTACSRAALSSSIFAAAHILINNTGIRKYEKVDEPAPRAGKRSRLRQPDERCLGKHARRADASQQGWRHRQRRFRAFHRSGRRQPAVRHHEGRGRGLCTQAAVDHYSPDGIAGTPSALASIFNDQFHQRFTAASGETVEQYNAKAARPPCRSGLAGSRRSLASPVFWPRIECAPTSPAPAVGGRRYDGAWGGRSCRRSLSVTSSGLLRWT